MENSELGDISGLKSTLRIGFLVCLFDDLLTIPG